MINSFLWAILTIMIFYFGVVFSFELKFPQFNFSSLINSLSKNKKGITPLNTLFLTLAGRIGVGSIAGVALAIYFGGPGTIFWIWVISFFSSPLAYCESLLGTKYKEKVNGEYFGGPSYYMKNGLSKKCLAFLYSFIVIVSYLFGFIPIQTNTIINIIDVESFNIFIGFLLTGLTLFIVFGGIKRVSKVTSKLVPLMTFFYFGLALISILKNINEIPLILKLIITSAFDLKPFFTGFLMSLLIGVQRGIFSNESGLGLGAIASSSSKCLNGSISGYVQILGVYITSFIICTSTAFIILTSDYNLFSSDINGIEITSRAFLYHFGELGNFLLIISVILFSFSTIITGYYYLESSFCFLFKKVNKNIIKIITSLSVFMGSVLSSNYIWSMIDTLVSFLGIINIYVLLKFKEEIKLYHKNYGKI